jgi:hypothetical protein
MRVKQRFPPTGLGTLAEMVHAAEVCYKLQRLQTVPL